MLYGYARVSSADQKLDRQIIALKEAGVAEENIYCDKQSGKDFNRPAYKKLMSKAQKGDLIIVKSLDRLGRNYTDILEQWRIINKVKEIDIKVLDMNLLDTTQYKDILGTLITDLVLQIFSFQAEQERTLIKQRQAEGIAVAKQKGVKFGRPRKNLPDNFEELYARFCNNEPINKIAKDCKCMSKSTLRLRLHERQELDKSN